MPLCAPKAGAATSGTRSSARRGGRGARLPKSTYCSSARTTPSGLRKAIGTSFFSKRMLKREPRSSARSWSRSRRCSLTISAMARFWSSRYSRSRLPVQLALQVAPLAGVLLLAEAPLEVALAARLGSGVRGDGSRAVAEVAPAAAPELELDEVVLDLDPRHDD